MSSLDRDSAHAGREPLEIWCERPQTQLTPDDDAVLLLFITRVGNRE